MRKPDFVVPGAPRSRRTRCRSTVARTAPRRRGSTHPEKTTANVQHWLYQNAWIVTGAKLGWWHGAEALEILIAGRRTRAGLWGIGARARSSARAALGSVEVESSMRRMLRRLSGERGYSLVETADRDGDPRPSIMAGSTTLFVQGSNAEIDMNNRFQAQQNARLALDKLQARDPLRERGHPPAVVARSS